MTDLPMADPVESGQTEQALIQLEAVIDLLRSNARSVVQVPTTYSADDDPLAEAARAMYRSRRRRSRHFDAFRDGFGEPMWDIMLDLFVAGREGRLVSISSATIAAEVPATTALRWLKLMEQDGMIERRDDPHDGRRTYVQLTAHVEIAMERYIREVTGARTG
ncbi:MarR family transcriptional regulator [Sphingomonas suaedae]|uniref:MarR family transcriptional regulator n=1 Tax=Sphingomonas suaedae TaxID=2599297 RepID=A0A518RCM9_9SPHN|nr:MarR family transcriptional regulator [Sphingomonas suaedae]QDX25169.1 MarR family transcriptional regulator [Sphingomonas suaedae]